MLVRFNATLGGATDEKARAINFLRCVQAVCTAAAGSTPSVQPVTAPSTLGTGDCIVEVISNAEAGGWTSSASTTATTSYSATNATYYVVDLYNSSTGKTTYPYAKVTFTTNLSYPFSAAFATYPYIDMIFGFHTATTADGAYLSGFTSNGVSQAADQWSAYRSRNITGMQGVGATTVSYSGLLSDRALRAANGEWLIASTANYIILMNSNGIFYYGMRSNAAWENNYVDNPYVIGFSYNIQGSNAASNATHTYASTCNNLACWGYGVDSTGAVNPAAPKWKHAVYYSGSVGPCPVGGQGIAASTGTGYYSWGYSGTNGYSGCLMPFGMRSQNGNTMVGPATDTSTGANVPPAYPIVANYSGSVNNWQVLSVSALTGMVLPGIYRSLAGSDAYMNQYYTAGTTYVVGTENYYPYYVGNYTAYRDLFLIRKY